MEPLFDGEPTPLPERSGPTWTVSSADPPKPPPVRHAAGYDPFVALASRFGTDPRRLFDLWTFAHFVRAHREALEADAALLHAAVVFLGNVLIANHPECCWTNHAPGLAVESEHGELIEIAPQRFREAPGRRSLRVQGTVPALLAADEARFLEFERVVADWRPGAPPRTPTSIEETPTPPPAR